MQEIKLPITMVRPDPHQPRVFFDPNALKELAQSIVTEGLINPIEVDHSNIIITGERRWRAAKIAGLTTIPVRRMELANDRRQDDDRRFRRQVIENIQTGSMTAFEDAIAMAKLLGLLPVRFVIKDKTPDKLGVEIASIIPAEYESLASEIKALGHEIGKSASWITSRLNILYEDVVIMRYILANTRKTSLFQEVNDRAPEQHKATMKQMIVEERIASRRTVREIISVLRERPDKASDLLKGNFGQKESQAILKIHQVVSEDPTTADLMEQDYTIIGKMAKFLVFTKSIKEYQILPKDAAEIEKLAKDIEEELQRFHTTLHLEGDVIEQLPEVIDKS